MPEQTQNEIEAELRRINFSRNRFAYLAQFTIISASVWYQNGYSGPNWRITLGLAFIGAFLRFFSTEVVRENAKFSNYSMWLGFFILGLAWGHHFHVNFEQGYPAAQSLVYLWFTVGGTAFVCYLTLVADPWAYVAFITPVITTMMVEYLSKGFTENFFVVLNLSLLVVLTSVSFRNQHRQLCDLIRSRIANTRERNRLKKIIDGIPGLVGIADNEGTYIDANYQILQIYPDLIGSKIGERAGPSSFTSFALDFLKSGKESATGETEVVMNGKHYYLMTTCGRLDQGMIIICLPTDELVQARKEIREKEAVALYSLKLASVGQMAAGVAHEVNNPLAIIQGSASIIAGLVQEENLDRSNLKLFSERIVATSDRIARIVKSLRSLTRGGEQDPFAPLSVKNLISSCQEISGHKLKGHDVTLMVPEKKDMTVLGREVQLGQVLLNLIANSIDAVKELPERWVKIDYGHEDGELWVEVVDSGKGIAGEIADKMMEPFFTTKKEEGTGLGLPISSKIMEEHGGKLFYDAEKVNTTFRMKFPTPKI